MPHNGVDEMTAFLDHGKSKTEFFCNDGEGYSLCIGKLSGPQIDYAVLPYQEGTGMGNPAGNIKPFRFFLADF